MPRRHLLVLGCSQLFTQEKQASMNQRGELLLGTYSMHAFEHEQEWVWISASSVSVHTLRDRVHPCQSVHCGNKQGLKATYSSLNCRDGGRRGWG